MALEALIFDLDGTLLDTLPDLVSLVNAIMDECGYPRHTTEEVLSYIGSGERALLRRAAPGKVSEEQLDKMSGMWHSMYPQFGFRQTAPFPGVEQALADLGAAGVRLGVLSNKFDAAAREVIEAFFPSVFDLVWGEGPDTPRKPDPTGLLGMARAWGLPPAHIGLVGDTGGTDMTAACAAGAVPIGVSWGYNSVESLHEAGARVVIDSPSELLALCRSLH